MEIVSVGKNIAAARKQAGLTQEELAVRVGYQSKSAINKIELGIRDLPQKKIKAFADALGTTPGHLLGWDTPKPATEQGALAANLLKDPDALRMLQRYWELSESDQYTIRLMVASLAEKKKD